MPVLSYKSPDLENGGATIEVKIFPPLAVMQEYSNKKEKVPAKKVIGLNILVPTFYVGMH